MIAATSLPRMEVPIEALLIDYEGGDATPLEPLLSALDGAGIRLRKAGLDGAPAVLAEGTVRVTLCAFAGDEVSSAVVRRFAGAAHGVPLVTFGPRDRAVAAVALGAEEHLSPEQMDPESLATVLQIAIERRRRWQALEMSEARLRALVHASADGLVIVDESGIVRFANDAAERLFNCQGEELIGSVLGTPSANAGVVELSIMSPETDEPIAAEMRVVEIEWHGKGGYIESIRDVTRHKKEVREAKEAIRMRDQFLATLSHELRNPLAALSNAAQVLSMEYGQFPQLHFPIEIIERQCHSMVRLLDELLDIARISQGKVELRRELVSLAELITDCLHALRPRIERTHPLKIQLPSEPLHVYADPSRLEQVLVNLLTNAAKYSPAGREIKLLVERSGDEAVLVVCDHGNGIPAEMLDSIFEPFVQVSPSPGRLGDGLGIGLAVVRRLVELHNGRVKATSSGIGQGSQFTVHLPVAHSGGDRARAEVPDCSRRFRICVVEDVHDIAYMMRRLLEKLGHDVTAVHDGEQAIETILDQRPDVAFVDIGLPGLSGYQVAEQLVKEKCVRDVVLVALTGYGQPKDRQRALEAGFHYHLVKPASFAGLRQCLAEIANRKTTKA